MVANATVQRADVQGTDVQGIDAQKTNVQKTEEDALKTRGLKHRDGASAGLKEDGLHPVDGDALETDAPHTANAGGADAGGANASGEGSTAPVASSRAELDLVREERDQLMERLARLQAEFENTRRREVKERSDLRDYAMQRAVEPFLSVMDNFQLALKTESTREQLRAGVELILKQMEEALKGLQVQAVETVGTQFDPRIHEAMGSIETNESPDHQVVEEIRRGYRIREKLLRPALVKIAINKAEVSD